ncbi:CHAT domain-containing protein [Winogradskyella tangerina]|uniref:CHAT domain-containing protein n=1 Tax=Winogradskyella tangerina TaxID=2023240 RepID=UPI000DBE516A|nr:CHAT domain-containing protein [Winogradskyella tangerina]
MQTSRIIALLLLVLVSTTNVLFSQNTNEANLKTLDGYLKDKNYTKAQQFAKAQIDSLIAIEKYYEVTDYVYYLGQIESKVNNTSSAINVIQAFEKKFESLTTNKKALRQLALETGSFYESIGDSETAKNYNLKALEITKQMPEATGKDRALIESNLGVFYSRLGDITTAIKYHKQGLKSLQSDTTSTADSYYISYNSLGGMMWYSSKFDSAIYYYKKADKTLKSLEQTPWNKFYRCASLNNNIAGIYSIQGDVDASIDAMQTTVKNLNAFLKEDISDVRRTYAQEFLFQAIENYAGLYKDIGDYKKAKQLLSYAFQLKNKNLAPESPEIAKGKVLLGQIEVSLRNYALADSLLNEGIKDFENKNGDYGYWLADAYYNKALVHSDLGNLDLAKSNYAKAEAYYKASLGNYYDELYLDFTVNASNFYSETGDKDKALSMANDALNYIKANQGEKTLLEYYQELNLADIYYQNGDYQNALKYCDRAIELINSNEFIEKSQLNSLRVESNKVSAILLKVKTNLKLTTTRNEAFLKAQLKELDDAIKLLENQKSVIANDNSTAIIIQDNIGVFKVAKELNLELFKLTNKEDFLSDLLGYHESMIYHKIRSRLNSKSSELTANLPQEILDREKALKDQLNAYLEEDSNFEIYIENEKKWLDFLEELKRNHPNYYELRYASISQSLKDLKRKIPASSTLVRYLYINEALHAFVIDAKSIKMVEINTENLATRIAELNNKTELITPTFKLQSDIYNQLWKPIEALITNEHLIIIPDKELFNLSFELLTDKVCSDFKEMGSNSLLSKYNISYNYSLFLIDKNSQPIGYDSNFIGFAPEFSDEMKTSYKIAIKDSVDMDYTYLKLLPQPFAKQLTQSYSKLFNGNSFLNENASKSVFTQNAKEHKIIHIGTHAESDNITPEFSRLIFAKSAEDENNSLYTYEIYNQNLASNLAILTACETGKPSYQPGEGMISLAHAFNYAGSESILTSLWKIDEQSSAKILEHFYDNISKGLNKDKALKAAKLKYLSEAEGRTASPQYWAGLVLIGDTAPIAINSGKNVWLWLLLGIIAVAAVMLVIRKRK